MKRTPTSLGTVSRVTRDYSGNFFWDNLIWDYQKYRPWN